MGGRLSDTARDRFSTWRSQARCSSAQIGRPGLSHIIGWRPREAVKPKRVRAAGGLHAPQLLGRTGRREPFRKSLSLAIRRPLWPGGVRCRGRRDARIRSGRES